MTLTNENKEFIVKNSYKYTIKQMAKIIKTDVKRIRNFCHGRKLDYIRERTVRNDYRFRITYREEEVIDLLLQGFSKEQIAEKLIISHSTVCTHVVNICTKLNYRCMTELVAKEWQKKIKNDYVEKSKVFKALNMLKNANNVAEVKELVEIIINKIDNF